MGVYQSITKAAQSLLSKAAELEAARKRLVKEIAELERQGVTEATPWWRPNSKSPQGYLYLIHPQRDGLRPREYIGTDPARVRDAMARVERHRRRTAALAELSEVEGSMTEILARLSGRYY